MASSNQKENYTFKLLYVIGTILVISGHLSNGGLNLLYDWFPPYAFHIGLFVFASGYFFRINNSLKEFVLRKIKTLIIPLFLWNLFYGIFVFILRYAGFEIGNELSFKNLFIMPIMDGHQFQYNMPGWFVIPLFAVHIYHAVLVTILEKIKKNTSAYIYFAIGMLLGISGVYLASKGFNTGIWLPIVRSLYFIPFYEAGVLYRSKLEVKDSLGSFFYFTIIFAIQLSIILIYQKTPDYSQSWCSNFIDGPVLPFVVGFLGIAFWLRVCKIMGPAIGHSKYILLIANNTFSIMINQFASFMIIKSVFAAGKYMFGWFSDFDMISFKTDIWYFYLPRGMEQFKLVYLAVGIIIPVLVQLLINKLKNMNHKNSVVSS